MRSLEENTELEIVYMETKSLMPYKNNSRKHSDQKVADMVTRIKRQGWTTPIEVDEYNTILSGHCRQKAAMLEGLKFVPVIVIKDLSDAQKAEYIIAANKLPEDVEWDYKNLNLEFDYLSSLGVDPINTGFDLSTIANIQNFTKSTAFNPKLEPDFTATTVSDQQVEKAADKMLTSTNTQPKDTGKEIMCPYCAETFSVTGV
tara:strand:- start:726 stop:1331 length:606 start_codon:yes stop_codon:yes gene_type:complete